MNSNKYDNEYEKFYKTLKEEINKKYDNHSIENIEYYNKNKEEYKRIQLELFVQDWIIRILNYKEEDTFDYSIGKLLEQSLAESENIDIVKDVLSYIVDNSRDAFKRLSNNLREKIIRENVQMPAYKVREVNSYGINWLSRQPGRTVREKISYAGNSMMAVKRRMSLDTAENRLFVAFAKEIRQLLGIKLDNLNGIYKESEKNMMIREEEEDFLEEVNLFLKREDIEEIKRWENLPPNNTLLSDQNYRKIWNAWNELKEIDEKLSENSKRIGSRLANIFYLEMLIYLNDKVSIPQEPLEIKYNKYKINLCSERIYCLDKNGNEVEIYLKDYEIESTIYANSKKNNIKLKFKNDKNSVIICTNKYDEEYDLSRKRLFDLVKKITKELIDIPEVKKYEKKDEKQKFKNVIVDLFSLYPGYIGDNNKYNKLSERIVQQRYIGKDPDFNAEFRDYYIPCDKTNAIKMIPGITNTYTVPFAVDNGNMEQMKRLMYMMESYIITDSFMYIFPDAYNDFQLSMVHKAAKIVYRNVKNIPMSIGAVFNYMKTDNLYKKFKINDFILVINLIDDEITFTLLEGKYNKEVKKDINEYKGIVWDRHPTTTKSLKTEINNKVIKPLKKQGCCEAEKIYKLIALDGFKEEVNKFSIFFGDNKWYQFDDDTKDIIDSCSLDITNSINEFLNRNKAIIRDSNVHIISIIDNFKYKGELSFFKMNKQDILEGCQNLTELEKRTEHSLWHDHLPSLAIKLMYGKFDLIKNACVVPKFGEKQNIDIEGTFILPKNCKEYHFTLVQDENARKMQYEAVIKNPMFPLKEDIECDLKMTYQYGEEEPYQLKFIPKDYKKAKFKEAKVKWFKMEEYDIKNLKSPKFPQKLSVEELKCIKSKNGEEINIFEKLGEYFKLVKEGYFTTNVSDTFKSEFTDKMLGDFLYTVDGEEVLVRWSQDDWDNKCKLPEKISDISFWLRPVKIKNKKIIRYKIENLLDASTEKNLWHLTRKGIYQSRIRFEYKGEESIITFTEDNFIVREWFHTGINNVSFEVKETKNGYLFAKNIIDEDAPTIPKIYKAETICSKGMVPEPNKYFVNSYHRKWMRELFANDRDFSDLKCPIDFLQIFSNAVDNWIELINYYREPKDKTKIFMALSLAANNIGKKYYIIANKLLKKCEKNVELQRYSIPDEIGCAFCDLSTEDQRDLYELTLNTIKEDSKRIRILSKAIWHNENFVYNVDIDVILKKYLPMTIDNITYELRKNKKTKDINTRNIGACLEFILGVMRLREKCSEDIIIKYLSLNNPKMQELYAYLEIIVDKNLEIDSFLKIEVPSKGEYDKIPDLVYVLLVYLTGFNIEGEIRISLSNNEEDEEDDEEDDD